MNIKKEISQLENKISAVKVPSKHKKLLDKAQKFLKVSPDAVVEIWNDPTPHFGGAGPHRYDDEKYCSYCYRPEDWKNVELQRGKQEYAEEAYSLLSESMYDLKKVRDYINKMNDPKAEKMYETMMKEFGKIYNYAMTKSVYGDERTASSEKEEFIEWLDTFLEEKGIDLEDDFTVQGAFYGDNHMTYEVVVEHIKIAPRHEQKKIKDMLVKIDFKNGDVKHFLRHLGQALAK